LPAATIKSFPFGDGKECGRLDMVLSVIKKMACELTWIKAQKSIAPII
jgi:hypothetical protein